MTKKWVLAAALLGCSDGEVAAGASGGSSSSGGGGSMAGGAGGAPTSNGGLGGGGSGLGGTVDRGGAGGDSPIAFVCDPPAPAGSLYETYAESMDIDLFEPVSMCQYRGDVLLIVNTAGA